MCLCWGYMSVFCHLSTHLFIYSVSFNKPTDSKINQYWPKACLMIRLLLLLYQKYVCAMLVTHIMGYVEIMIEVVHVNHNKAVIIIFQILKCQWIFWPDFFFFKLLLNFHSWQILAGEHRPIKHLLVKAQLPFSRTVFSAWSHICSDILCEHEIAKQQKYETKICFFIGVSAVWRRGKLLWCLFNRQKLHDCCICTVYLCCMFLYQRVIQLVCSEKARL